MNIEKELLQIEHELAAGSDREYRARLAEDAIVIVPGRALTKAETVAAMRESPGWDAFRIVDPHVIRSGPDVVGVTYRFEGTRDADFGYAALMSSVYSRASGDWKLVLHQQTPITSSR